MGWQDRAYNQGEDGFRQRMGFSLPPAYSLGVIIACLVVFFLQAFSGAGLSNGPVVQFGELTLDHGKGFIQPWRFITYQYLHGTALHIFFNVLVIFFFLPQLEAVWGGRKALLFYTMGGIAGGLLFALMTVTVDGPAALIGASGSALACIGACAVLFPEQRIWFIPIRVFALLVGLLYLLATVGERDLSDAAHLGGLLFGVGFAWRLDRFVGTKVEEFVEQREESKREKEQQQIEDDERTLDELLAKIGQGGMESLSGAEKRTLERLREKKQNAIKPPRSPR